MSAYVNWFFFLNLIYFSVMLKTATKICNEIKNVKWFCLMSMVYIYSQALARIHRENGQINPFRCIYEYSTHMGHWEWKALLVSQRLGPRFFFYFFFVSLRIGKVSKTWPFTHYVSITNERPKLPSFSDWKMHQRLMSLCRSVVWLWSPPCFNGLAFE